MVKHMPTIYKALDLIPSTSKINNKQINKEVNEWRQE
jgi:hypothetical protein